MKFFTTYNDHNYPVIIEHGAIKHLSDLIENYDQSFLLVDEAVYQLWSNKIDEITHSSHTYLITLTSGEALKTITHYQTTMEHILSYQPTRNTCLVSIGGGATGDFVGFLASTLLRGVDFLQVPTTLLAHDSSIGGKVGINASKGKNLIGAFHRPIAVLYDLEFLTTLPKTEIQSGYAEIYKHALLSGHKETNTIERVYPSINDLVTLQNIDTFIQHGIQTKLNIVVQDELEKGMRQYLNLGHTFGHAVEYHLKMPHGHAVMIGILYQFIVTELVYSVDANVQHYYHYFTQLGYPLDSVRDIPFESLLSLMKQDKKNHQNEIHMVLLKELGKPIVQQVDISTLRQAFTILQQLINKGGHPHED